MITTASCARPTFCKVPQKLGKLANFVILEVTGHPQLHPLHPHFFWVTLGCCCCGGWLWLVHANTMLPGAQEDLPRQLPRICFPSIEALLMYICMSLPTGNGA